MAVAAARQLVADAAWSTAHIADLAACDTPAEAAFQLRVVKLAASTCSASYGCAKLMHRTRSLVQPRISNLAIRWDTSEGPSIPSPAQVNGMLTFISWHRPAFYLARNIRCKRRKQHQS